MYSEVEVLDVSKMCRYDNRQPSAMLYMSKSISILWPVLRKLPGIIESYVEPESLNKKYKKYVELLKSVFNTLYYVAPLLHLKSNDVIHICT